MHYSHAHSFNDSIQHFDRVLQGITAKSFIVREIVISGVTGLHSVEQEEIHHK